jgi:conjugal transfer pilus assembly protein TraB
MITDSFKAKILQKKILVVSIAVVFFITGFSMFFGKEEKSVKPVIKDSNIAYNMAKDISPRGFEWDLANRVDKQNKDLEDLQQKIESKEQLEQKISEELENANAQNEDLLARLNALEEKIYTGVSNNVNSPKHIEPNSEYNGQIFDNGSYPANPGNAEDDKKLVVHKFALDSSGLRRKNIANTIPSNSFIKARLANGVDISASQTSQQNPKPVLLTITGWGNLPNNHKLKTLKQCRMHATAWGDMSSERVYLSPDLLTCIAPNGDIIETSVQGYVSSEDGAAGIRGRMIMRDTELLTAAVLAGTLSGIGNGFAAAQGSTSSSPLGSTTTYDSKEIVKSGVGKGVGNGFDMLARYKIKQAENLQPIIQINGGREISVVFYRNAELGVVSAEQSPKSAQNNNSKELISALAAINQMGGDDE